MSEFDWEMVEKERMSFEDRVTLAVARVQGSWNQKSKSLLTAEIPNDDLKEESPNSLEARLMDFAMERAVGLFGDGSIAGSISGHSLTLSESERGLIALMVFVPENHLPESSDWKRLAVLTLLINQGGDLSEIFSKFKKNVDKRGGIIGKMAGVKNLEDKNRDRLEHLENLSGGSEEALRQNKEDTEKELIESLRHELRSQPLFKLISISRQLNSGYEGEDEIVSSSIGSARELFKELVQPEVKDLFAIMNLE